jgi:hypothetical protein
MHSMESNYIKKATPIQNKKAVKILFIFRENNGLFLPLALGFANKK